MKINKRVFKVTFITGALVIFLGVGSETKEEEEVKNFFIGIDNSGDKTNPGDFFNPVAMDSLGVEFVVYHYRGPEGTVEDEAEKMKKMGADFQQAGLKVVVNVECGNWALDMKSSDGYEWVNQPGNLHLFKFPPSVLKILGQSDAVWGIQYDELEHSQITRNLSITLKHPGIELVSLAETTGMDFKSADSAVYHGAKSLVNECRSGGIQQVLTEHVWPVLFHNFARAGMTPAYKQMKENWSNIMASCAIGACLQYNQELWACIDLWYHNNFPGHSDESLWSNLIFAYWAGVDKAYVESIGNHIYEIDDHNRLILTEMGKILSRFSKEYVPRNPRPYTFRDLEPEIAIIRFDDTEWGQGTETYCTVDVSDMKKVKLYWKDWLFGAYNLRTSPESEEWIKAWHTITHGMVKKESLSWNACNIYDGMAYRCFAPANSVVVFDDSVTKKNLGSVKLVFLCGLFISEKTLEDVGHLVRKDGLVVVTSKRFAPREFVTKYESGTKAFKDGKGKWIITDDMASDDLKKMVAPWTGNDNEIVFRFKGNRKIVMTISPDGKEVDVKKKGI